MILPPGSGAEGRSAPEPPQRRALVPDCDLKNAILCL
jgi:hypothetical protein